MSTYVIRYHPYEGMVIRKRYPDGRTIFCELETCLECGLKKETREHYGRLCPCHIDPWDHGITEGEMIKPMETEYKRAIPLERLRLGMLSHRIWVYIRNKINNSFLNSA